MKRHFAQHAGQLKADLKAALSVERLRELHECSAWRHFLVVAWQLALIAGATTVLVSERWPWAWPLAMVVQGFCVFNFTVLLHDNLHRAVFAKPRPKLERLLALAYSLPSGISASQFTRWHLDHHAELGSSTGDPKRHHLSPKRNSRWLKLAYLTPLLFPIYFRAAARETATYEPELRARIKKERLASIGFHLSLLIGLAVLVSPMVALRVHAIPVFLVFPVAFTLNRMGQHYWIDPKDPAAWGTLVRRNWFWNVAFLCSNMHLEHHYYPGVPLYRLPALQRELEGFYKERGMVAHGYGELVWNWLVRNKPPHANWSSDEVEAVGRTATA
ncbi:MAG: fatty acid desaturase [Acidobacteriota bacterium]